MTPITIQCVRCSACLLLGVEIQARIRGRSGRLPCSGCGEKLRIDGRGEQLEFTGARLVELATLELDEAPSARGEQLSLLPPAPAKVAGRTPPPLPRSLPPRPSVVHPPRPSGAPRPMLASNPFDELGSLAPVVPLQGVRLTADGRLVNRADEAPKTKRSRMRTWAPLAAAGLLATGFASARVGSMLPLGRSKAPQVAEVASSVLDQRGAPAAADQAASGEPRLLTDEPAQHAPLGPAAADEGRADGRNADGRNVDGRNADGRNADEDNAEREDVSATSRSRAAAESTEGSAETRLAGAEGRDVASSEGGDAASPESAAPEVGAVADDQTSADDAALGPEFSREAALVALQHAEAEAISCRQPGDPAGNARVIVTFAPSGRVTTANVSGVYAATLTGGCIAGRFRAATVPAFVGSHVTVSKTISLQ